ncbi:MAG: site-2 protease family protein [Thermoleophilia bacterium]|nr:site-2 protease family protein [Thermoleophilia bacterium]
MSRLLDLLFLLPLLLLSMMAHEVAHGLVAYRLGDPTAKAHGRLTANPIQHLDPLGSLMFVVTYLFGGFVFGWAKPVPVNPYYFRDHQRGMMVVGLAGPFTNFLIAVVLAVILNLLEPVSSRILSVWGGDTLFNVLFLAYQVNVVLGIFNLVPIPPLDGSRVLGGFLSPAAYRAWTELDRYGMMFILLIFFVFQAPFFRVLGTAFRLVSRVLLPAYPGLF